MATAQKNATRRAGASSRSNGSRPKAQRAGGPALAERAKGPALAGSAAVAGLAAGTLLGWKRRARRRPRVLGLPLPRGSELKSGAEQAARAGRWVASVQRDVRAVREQAELAQHQSPIEVLLSGLTSRRLPRHRSAAD
jgi:hypothetical protein